MSVDDSEIGWVARWFQTTTLGFQCVMVVLISPLMLACTPFWVIGKVAMFLKLNKHFD
jgi:hypothetical protein